MFMVIAYVELQYEVRSEAHPYSCGCAPVQVWFHEKLISSSIALPFLVKIRWPHLCGFLYGFSDPRSFFPALYRVWELFVTMLVRGSLAAPRQLPLTSVDQHLTKDSRGPSAAPSVHHHCTINSSCFGLPSLWSSPLWALYGFRFFLGNYLGLWSLSFPLFFSQESQSYAAWRLVSRAHSFVYHFLFY